MIKILESNNNKDSTITITLNDPDNIIMGLLNDIKNTSEQGHSFDILVDPDAEQVEELPRSYTVDGDGSFRILDIQIKYINKE